MGQSQKSVRYDAVRSHYAPYATNDVRSQKYGTQQPKSLQDWARQLTPSGAQNQIEQRWVIVYNDITYLTYHTRWCDWQAYITTNPTQCLLRSP